MAFHHRRNAEASGFLCSKILQNRQLNALLPGEQAELFGLTLKRAWELEAE